MKRFFALLVCLCLFLGMAPAASAARSVDFEQTLAQDLKQLGLFQGVSETDFALNRAPTRVEALVMLIRVLGAESSAAGGSWYHPFTDVPSWANNYVGYAYENGLTKGISATAFGTGSATAQMYLTFVLRALGYSDSTGDFTWQDPYTLAEKLNLLPRCVDRSNFWRADVATVSYAALPAYLKDSGLTLADKLMAAGVFTAESYNAVYRPDAISQHTASLVMTAEQVFAACAPAVFYVEVYDKSGRAFASGSGFFLQENGIAVTNYHVIEDAVTAKITTNDGKTFDISGVRAWSKEEDWAIVQVNGSGFPALTPATQVNTGEKVFAIGSPLGLQNTISEGLVSTASREVDGMSYIQISAAISNGSSGGALLNTRGQVVGITSAGFKDGQNLNLAIPIAKVLNKDLSGLTTLQTMFGGYAPASSADAATAVRLLKSFVAEKSNYTFLDKYPAIRLTDNSGSTSTVFVLYNDPEDKSASMNLVFNFTDGAQASMWLSLLPGGTASWAAYYYYDRSTDANWSAKGSAEITNPAFSKNTPLPFGEYQGSDREIDAKIAALLVDLMLSNLDAIFDAYADYFGGCSIASFGFPAR